MEELYIQLRSFLVSISIWEKGKKSSVELSISKSQTVYVEFDNNGSIPDTSSFDSMPGNCSNPNNETVPLASSAARVFDPFTMTIGSGSPAGDIETVQKLLARVRTYTGAINGLYNDHLSTPYSDSNKQTEL